MTPVRRVYIYINRPSARITAKEGLIPVSDLPQRWAATFTRLGRPCWPVCHCPDALDRPFAKSVKLVDSDIPKLASTLSTILDKAGLDVDTATPEASSKSQVTGTASGNIASQKSETSQKNHDSTLAQSFSLNRADSSQPE